MYFAHGAWQLQLHRLLTITKHKLLYEQTCLKKGMVMSLYKKRDLVSVRSWSSYYLYVYRKLF